MTQPKAYVPDEPGESPLRSDLRGITVDQAIREWCEHRNQGVDKHRFLNPGTGGFGGEAVPLRDWLHGEVDSCLYQACLGMADSWNVTAQRFQRIMEETLMDYFFRGVELDGYSMGPTRIEWFRGRLERHLRKAVKLASGLG